jgi:hypothetical protein
MDVNVGNGQPHHGGGFFNKLVKSLRGLLPTSGKHNNDDIPAQDSEQSRRATLYLSSIPRCTVRYPNAYALSSEWQ